MDGNPRSFIPTNWYCKRHQRAWYHLQRIFCTTTCSKIWLCCHNKYWTSSCRGHDGVISLHRKLRCMAGDPVRQWAWPWPALGSNRSMARKYRFRPGTYTGNGNLCHRHFCWLRRWPSCHLVIRFFHANTILPNRIVSTYCGLAHLQTSQTRTKGRIF